MKSINPEYRTRFALATSMLATLGFLTNEEREYAMEFVNEMLWRVGVLGDRVDRSYFMSCIIDPHGNKYFVPMLMNIFQEEIDISPESQLNFIVKNSAALFKEGADYVDKYRELNKIPSFVRVIGQK